MTVRTFKNTPPTKWLLLLASLLVGLAACEGLLRLGSQIQHRGNPRKALPDSELGWASAPDLQASYETPGYGAIEYSTTEAGFRVMGDPTSERTKVLVVGDSFTQAYHVSDGAAYFDYLARKDDRIELFVYGVGGYSTLQEALALERYLADIDPDIVLWQFHPNDLIGADVRLESKSGENNNHMTRPYLEDGEIVLRHPDGLLGVLASRSHLFRRIAVLRGSIRKRLGTVEDDLQPGHPDLERGLAAMRRTVARLVATEPDRWFVAFQAPAHRPSGYEEYVFDQICETPRLRCVPGLTRALAAARAAGLPVDGGDDPHWNKTGHAIVGEVLLGYLRSSGLLATDPTAPGEPQPNPLPPPSGVETEYLYLSGRGADDATPWKFRCSEGRGCGAWQTIAVPSNWELEGFGSYNYGLDEDPSGEVGHYRVTFRPPAHWSERRVELVFEGSMTDTRAWINGRPVGPAHQGGFYRFQHDISALLVPGTDNELEVEVRKRSLDRSINRAERDADYWVFGGIFRPVLLAAHPAESIRQVAIDAGHDGRLAVEIKTEGARPGDTVTARVQALDGTPIGPVFEATVASAETGVRLAGTVPGVESWSAEQPSLYRLVVTLERGSATRHRMTERFGFRTVEVRPGDGLYVNGKRTLLKGINRHSFWPDSGRTTSREISREDAELLVRMNVNAVRSSHYPPDKHFLEICDELGLYVINELAGWHDAYDDGVGAALVRELVGRDVNHPSILLWANGNEGGWNADLDEVFWEFDPQRRPVIHPDAIAGGFDTQHYLSYDELEAKLEGSRLGDRIRGWFAPRPLVLPTELLHGLYDGGMGAGLDEYWRALRASPNAAGTFLWAFLDEAVVRTDRGGVLDSDGNHAPDGVVGPYRAPEPSFDTIRALWSPIVAATDSGTFDGALRLENRFAETGLADCRFDWELIDFQEVGAAEPLAVPLGQGSRLGPRLGPGETGTLDLGADLPADWRRADVLTVTAVDHRLRDVMTWTFPIERGEDRGPIELEGDSDGRALAVNRPESTQTAHRNPVQVRETADTLVLEVGATRVEIDLASGGLRGFARAGAEFPITGPALAHGASRLASLEHRALDRGYEVTATFDGDLESIRWRLTEIGRLELDYSYRVAGSHDFSGVTFEVPRESLTGFRWLGRGPHPVWRNRMAGGRLGLWGTTGPGSIACGAYAEVAWARLQGPAGALVIEPGSPDLFLSPCAPEYPADAGYTAAPAPEGLALLDLVAAMGTKFHRAEELGPASRDSDTKRLYRGSVSLGIEPPTVSSTPEASPAPSPSANG